MRVRYFADDGVYDVEVPEGSRIGFRSHVQVGPESFLDDLLLVPWQGRLAPIPGEILPVLARSAMYGLSLVDHRGAAPTGRARRAAPRRGVPHLQGGESSRPLVDRDPVTDRDD